MTSMQSWIGARATKKALRKDTFEGYVTDFIATHEARQAGAQVFLVEQDPNWVTPPHFHLEHQFQIVIAGEGAIGRHAVAPLTVHYAAPQTGYGPIVAGPQGVSYLTLRVSGDTGAWYLHKPGSRERLEAGRKPEQQHGAPAGAIDADALARLAATSLTTLIAPRVDGLAAHLVRMGPRAEFALPAEHAHGGRYYVVTQGAIDAGGADSQGLFVLHASAEESPAIRSGPAGAELLVLQFPRDASQADGTLVS